MSHNFSFKKYLRFAFITIAAAIVSAPYARAQSASFDLTSFDAGPQAAVADYPGGNVAATGGDQVSPQAPRQNYIQNMANRTSNQRLPLAIATRTILSQKSQKLPQTTLDSFVYQSGMSDQIYGDEGSSGPPPFSGMDESHTIGSGIMSGELTTGHASDLPSAWTSYY